MVVSVVGAAHSQVWGWWWIVQTGAPVWKPGSSQRWALDQHTGLPWEPGLLFRAED